MIATSALPPAMDAVLEELDHHCEVLSRSDLSIHEAIQVRASLAGACFRGLTLIRMHQKILALQLDEMASEEDDELIGTN